MSWRSWREQRGMTQEEAAALLGISRAHFSRLETGRRSMSLETARTLATAYGLTPSERAGLLSSEPDLPTVVVGELVILSLLPEAQARSPQEVTAQLVALFTSLADDADSAGGWYEEVSGPNEDTVACEARAQLLRCAVARLQASIPAAEPAPPPASPDASDLAPTPTPTRGAA